MPDLLANRMQRPLINTLLDLIHDKIHNLLLRLLRQLLQRNIRDTIDEPLKLDLVSGQSHQDAIGDILALAGAEVLVLGRVDLDDGIREPGV